MSRINKTCLFLQNDELGKMDPSHVYDWIPMCTGDRTWTGFNIKLKARPFYRILMD